MENGYLYLTQAALLHDIGKVFIPSEILNKKGKLTPKEREIVQLHNRLSYEILKTTDLNPKVAQLAYEHHDYEKQVKRTEENQ
jgi:HD-GYP domain-containing protein (c-di-GMP phosphodiesterase class II)